MKMNPKIKELLSEFNFTEYSLNNIDNELELFSEEPSAEGRLPLRISFVQSEFKVGSPTYLVFDKIYALLLEEDPDNAE